MELMRWNPTRDVATVANRFQNLFDTFFSSVSNRDHHSLWAWNPAVDVYEDGDKIVVKAELPGMEKEEIAVDINGRVLSLKGERSGEHQENDGHYYRRERVFGSFERRFTLPVNVDPASVKAVYKDGVLKIEVPKPESPKTGQIEVS